ncbi:Protein kinase-like domain [Cordyceps militaris CM01]|uniref:Protein kinase-like domain n=1 Tax=Cordyceps militaris (strain CM01) TaxID=983644 RepID=G3J2V2_CORMM|nr:Protein kinase-like domain [Cordyceps militaris CM01]EGX97231.1 Protein kinase-like domain [Cordyceps militaris CM01]
MNDNSTSQPPSSPQPNEDYEIQLPVYRRPGEPEHYRLSAARLAGRPYLERPLPAAQPIHFWFRTRCLSATAAQLSDLHPHVLGLQLRPSAVANLIASAVGLLPPRVQGWIRALFPEWFLPDCVVMKMRKSGECEEILDEHFDAELKAYRLMRPIQGLIIPQFFGSVRYKGQRAMILEHVQGILMSSPEGATLRLSELAALLLPCYRALHPFRVQYDDINLSNFVLVDGRMRVLDLESAVFDSSDRDMALFTKLSIQELAQRYMSMQAYYRHEGSLEAAE